MNESNRESEGGRVDPDSIAAPPAPGGENLEEVDADPIMSSNIRRNADSEKGGEGRKHSGKAGRSTAAAAPVPSAFSTDSRGLSSRTTTWFTRGCASSGSLSMPPAGPTCAGNSSTRTNWANTRMPAKRGRRSGSCTGSSAGSAHGKAAPGCPDRASTRKPD